MEQELALDGALDSLEVAAGALAVKVVAVNSVVDGLQALVVSLNEQIAILEASGAIDLSDEKARVEAIKATLDSLGAQIDSAVV